MWSPSAEEVDDLMAKENLKVLADARCLSSVVVPFYEENISNGNNIKNRGNDISQRIIGLKVN